MSLPAAKLIVLAAGKGKRLQSEKYELPKALRMAAGKPLIRWVLDNASFIAPEDTVVVVGYRKEQVMDALGPRYQYQEQAVVDGTAHAAEYARPAPTLRGWTGPVMVLYCDMPLLSALTYKTMLHTHAATRADQTLLAAVIEPPPAYGRLIRDGDGRLVDIVEESSCTPAQAKIPEVNVGIQVFNGADMWDMLAQVPYAKEKHERYLTAAAKVYAEAGKRVEVVRLLNNAEALGVNSEDDLARAEALLRG